MTFVLSDPDHSSGLERDKRSLRSGLERGKGPGLTVSAPGQDEQSSVGCPILRNHTRTAWFRKPWVASMTSSGAQHEGHGRSRPEPAVGPARRYAAGQVSCLSAAHDASCRPLRSAPKFNKSPAI